MGSLVEVNTNQNGSEIVKGYSPSMFILLNDLRWYMLVGFLSHGYATVLGLICEYSLSVNYERALFKAGLFSI